MRNITKLGAVLVTAVTLLATSAWAVPGNGNSEQWTYELYAVDFPNYVPCIGEDVLVQGAYLIRWNFRTTPAGEIGYTMQFLGGDVVITVPSTQKKYYLREGRCLQENSHGPSIMEDWGTDIWHVVFEAEDGSRLIHHGIALYEATGDPLNPWAFKKFVWTFTCK